MLEKREADVIIIGGGIMGCATAYRLAKRGVDVLVLEKKEIGNGGSCRNAGGVRQSARDPKELPLAMYAVQNIWPQLSEELGVDVEYHQGGNLRLGLTDKDIKVLENHTAKSTKLGRKDIIKIDRILDLDWDVIGYVDPGITVNFIKDGKQVEKRQLKLPTRIKNVIHCKNPRCITSVEQELPQVFTLTDTATRTYRCLYCEAKAENA